MENSYGQHQPPQTPCNPPAPSQFDMVLTEFGKALEPLISAAASAQTNLTMVADTKRDTVCTARAVSRHIAKGIKEYTFFSNCITMSATKDAEELVGTAKETGDKNSKMAAAYKTVIDSIKAAKQKIEQVKTLTDKLNADVPNSCNSEELKQIKASFTTSGNKKNFESSVAEMSAYVTKITNGVDDLSESAVKVAGINAFINVKSISDAAAGVKQAADALVTDVDLNLKSLQTDYDAGKKDLADSQKQFSSATLLKYKSVAAKQGLDWMKILVGNPNCTDPDGSKKLKELVQKAAESFNESCAEKPSVESSDNTEEETV